MDRGRECRVVPELIKKKVARDETLKKQAAEEKQKKKTARKGKVTEWMARGEKWYKEDKQSQKALTMLKRQVFPLPLFLGQTFRLLLCSSRSEGGVCGEDQGVRGDLRKNRINTLHPRARKILALLRLRQLHNGTFVKLNKATVQMLRLVEPYVTYGYPNKESISKLIYKRGYLKEAGSRVPIQSNEQIEKYLGKHGIICLEDLVHEIASCGPHFKEANNLLWYSLPSLLGPSSLIRQREGSMSRDTRSSKVETGAIVRNTSMSSLTI